VLAGRLVPVVRALERGEKALDLGLHRPGVPGEEDRDDLRRRQHRPADRYDDRSLAVRCLDERWRIGWAVWRGIDIALTPPAATTRDQGDCCDELLHATSTPRSRAPHQHASQTAHRWPRLYVCDAQSALPESLAEQQARAGEHRLERALAIRVPPQLARGRDA